MVEDGEQQQGKRGGGRAGGDTQKKGGGGTTREAPGQGKQPVQTHETVFSGPRRMITGGLVGYQQAP